MTDAQKERVRTAVHWKLASVPPDVRDAIRYVVTKKFIRIVMDRDQIASEAG